MATKMTIEEKDEYIKKLEENMALLLEDKNRETEIIVKAQENFLISKYVEMDSFIYEMKRLTADVDRLTKTIIMDQHYIDYLLNSFWWKLTFPLRKISRKIKQKSTDTFQIVPISENIPQLNVEVAVVIFTYNAGREFYLQLENLEKQQLIKKINIIVIDKGSCDETVKIAKEKKVTLIDAKGYDLNDDELYSKCVSKVRGDYVAIINQNKVIDSNYFLYQSIRALEDGQTTLVAFLNKNYPLELNKLRNEMLYHGMKNRLCKIGHEEVLFLPKDRDMVLYMTPDILDKSDIVIKKKSSNLFLL